MASVVQESSTGPLNDGVGNYDGNVEMMEDGGLSNAAIRYMPWERRKVRRPQRL
jgi:hypothetical protein